MGRVIQAVKSTKKRPRLFSSVVIFIAAAVVLTAGLSCMTYAWFVKTALSDGSEIKSGIFNLELYRYNVKINPVDETIDVSNFADKCEEITREDPLFSSDEKLLPGTGEADDDNEIIRHVAVVNKGDAFSEYGLMFTVKEDGSERSGEDEASVADVIDVSFAVRDKDGKTGNYIYIGKLKDIAKSDAYASEEDVFGALDANDGNIIRGLLLTSEEAEGEGYDGEHTRAYDPEEGDENFSHSIEKLRQSLMPQAGQPASGDYKQIISIKLSLPEKTDEKYQNQNVQVGLRLIGTQNARELCTITAISKPDNDGRIMGVVTGGGIYHKNTEGDEDTVTLTPVPYEGYRFSKWTKYGTKEYKSSENPEVLETGQGSSNSDKDEIEAKLDGDYTYVFEFIKDSEFEEIDIPNDDDWED